MKTRLLMMLGLCLGICCGPDNDDNALGGGSNVGNAFDISGSIQYAEGISADIEGVEAVMFKITAEDSLHYSWEAVDTAATDSKGEFGFDGVEEGYYSVFILNDGLGAFSGYLFYHEQINKNLGAMILDTLNNISGSFSVIDSTNYIRYQMRLVGTPVSQIIASGAEFIINSVPWGNYKVDLRLYGGAGSAENKVGYVSLPVQTYNDTTYESNYSDLPSLDSNDGDSIKVQNDSTSVVSPEYTIEFVIQ